MTFENEEDLIVTLRDSDISTGYEWLSSINFIWANVLLFWEAARMFWIRVVIARIIRLWH